MCIPCCSHPSYTHNPSYLPHFTTPTAPTEMYKSINHTAPRHVISILATYPAHRNLPHFTTLTTPDNLYKSHSSFLSNIHPIYMTNLSPSFPSCNTAKSSFSLRLLASKNWPEQFPESIKSVHVSRQDPTKQAATQLVFCVPIYRAFWIPGWTAQVVKLTGNTLRTFCSPFHHVSHFFSYNKTNEVHWFLKFIFGIELYMFRTVSLSIIRRLALFYSYDKTNEVH
jgi:hypothetical protein